MDHYLAVHRDVFMARKEMHFFGADLRFGPQFYRRDREAYLGEFRAASGHRLAGESSVWYLYSEQAAAEIKAFNPDARIIVMLRHPVEMLHSLYHQFRFDGNEHLATFEEALSAENDRRAGRRLGRQNYFAQGLRYREAARYSLQVERYFKVFGRERVHVVLYDDFAAEPAAAYRRTLEFLGLSDVPVLGSFKAVNGNKQVRNPVLRAVLNDPCVRRSVLAIRPWIPKLVFDALHDAEARLRKLNTASLARQPLDSDLRHRLNLEFAPDIERLSGLLRRDLSAWSRNACWQNDLAAPAPVREPATGLEAAAQPAVGVV